MSDMGGRVCDMNDIKERGCIFYSLLNGQYL